MLKLQDQMALPAKALPGGGQEKGRTGLGSCAPPGRRRPSSSLLQLSFALSILGSPVLLLDLADHGMTLRAAADVVRGVGAP